METICTEYIYSNEYADFTVDYKYDINNVINRFNPLCINQITRKFYVAYKKIDNIIEMPITEYGYSAFPKLYGLLDMDTLEEIGVTDLRRIPGFDLDGSDVIIGLVDTGINYNLDIFKYDEYSSRILTIWDQDIYKDESRSYAGYGRVYTNEEINRAIIATNPYEIVEHKDNIGHGTTLAAVAAGGVDLNNNFSGVATNSQLVVVKLKNAKDYLREYYQIENNALCYQDNDIMAGIQFILDEANRVKKPVVICLGVGSNLGSHDGRDNLSQYIDDFSNNAGIAVIVAGGNEVIHRHHYEGKISLNDSNMVETIELNVGENISGFSLEIWIEAPNTASIGFRSPMGENTGIIQMRQNRSEKLEFLFDRTEIYVDMRSVEENTGNALIFVRFFSPSNGLWNIDLYKEIRLEGKYGVWLPLNGLVAEDVYFVNASPNTTLVSVANGTYSIAVGGYNSQSQGIYVNSSRGYTFDDRIKPDIVAPAVEVISPNARGDISPSTGTSIASALTAGSVALLFQWAASVIYFMAKTKINETNLHM